MSYITRAGVEEVKKPNLKTILEELIGEDIPIFKYIDSLVNDKKRKAVNKMKAKQRAKIPETLAKIEGMISEVEDEFYQRGIAEGEKRAYGEQMNFAGKKIQDSEKANLGQIKPTYPKDGKANMKGKK